MLEGSNFILGHNERPEWLRYPRGLVWLARQDMVRFGQWQLLSGAESPRFSEPLCSRYGREYFAIAWRAGSDDVACLEKGSGETVKIIDGHTDRGRQVLATSGHSGNGSGRRLKT